MASSNFSLADLFEKSFGYKSQAFSPKFDQVYGFLDGSKSDDRKYRVNNGAHGSPYYSNDENGREYFLPITLRSSLGTIDLPYPVISIISKKTIIETPLTERRGTVKEFINIQDYEILVKGLIINESNEFPESDVRMLRDIYELIEPVSIINPVTDIFLLRPERKGCDLVIIKDLKFPSSGGVKNVRPYELTLMSDEPFNLKVVE